MNTVYLNWHWLTYLQKDNSHWIEALAVNRWTFHGCAYSTDGPSIFQKWYSKELFCPTWTTAATLFFLENSSEHVTSVIPNSHVKSFQIEHPLIFPTLFSIFSFVHYSFQPIWLHHFFFVEGIAHVLLLLIVCFASSPASISPFPNPCSWQQSRVNAYNSLYLTSL